MKYIKLFAFVAVLAATAACSVDNSGDDTCIRDIYTGVSSITGPDNAIVDEPIELEASITTANTCGTFSGFAQSAGYPKEIVAVVTYQGCHCDPVGETTTETYTFKEDEAGTYVLKFLKPDNTFLTKIITVSEE